MSTVALSLVALLLAGGGDPTLHWKDKDYAFDALPPELPPAAHAAVGAWMAWAKTADYRMDLDPSARVLLVTRAANGHIEKQMELVAGVLERFDRELVAPAQRREVPPPASALEPKKPEKPAKTGDHPPLPEDPEDPEGGDHPWKIKPQTTTTAPEPVTVTRWGALDVPFDTETMVLLVLRNPDDFEVVLKSLGKTFPHLADWSKEAKALQGFVLPAPLVGAYLETHPSLEEWDPDHELVSRLARLSLLRRFGELPNWFALGYAWHLEIALQGAVYCFPWRDEFVWATEHTAWPHSIEQRYERERVKPGDFLAFVRGKYVDDMARASWAMVEYLVAKETAKLPDLLDELRVYREEHGRIMDDARTWHRDVDYEIPAAEQQALMLKHLGPYLDRATFWLRKELVPE